MGSNYKKSKSFVAKSKQKRKNINKRVGKKKTKKVMKKVFRKYIQGGVNVGKGGEPNRDEGSDKEKKPIKYDSFEEMKISSGYIDIILQVPNEKDRTLIVKQDHLVSESEVEDYIRREFRARGPLYKVILRMGDNVLEDSLTYADQGVENFARIGVDIVPQGNCKEGKFEEGMLHNWEFRPEMSNYQTQHEVYQCTQCQMIAGENDPEYQKDKKLEETAIKFVRENCQHDWGPPYWIQAAQETWHTCKKCSLKKKI